MSTTSLLSPVKSLTEAYDRERFDDVGFMTCMTLVMMGNYAQTGHFGGPLAYTPYNVALHLAGPNLGGLRYDYRRPKHPFCDKFMLAGGHNIPTSYALWMIMGEALSRKHAATGDARYRVDPNDAILPIDALGFRRGAGALATLLKDNGLEDQSAFRAGRAARHSRPRRPFRDHRRDQRRERRSVRHRHRHRGGQGGLLELHRRPGQPENPEHRRRVCHDRGARPGAQDPGGGHAGGQAPARPAVAEQRRYRRHPDRRRRGRQVRPLPDRGPVDLVRLERLRAR